MLPALLLIPAIALFRVFCAWHTSVGPGPTEPFTWLAGFSPLAALALCAGVFLPRRLALGVPLGVLLLSDGIIDTHYGASMLTTAVIVHYVALALIAWFGLWLRHHGGTRPAALIGGTVAASLGFYLFTITACWWGSAHYAQTFGGWLSAVTLGEPGYAPSYLFFRNGLVSDLLYSILVLACARPAEKRAAEPFDARALYRS